MAELHAIVYGSVQGISFRYHTVQRAKALALNGTVQNLADGSVEVFAQGEKPELLRLLEWLRQGPSGATVKKVDFEWLQPGKKFEGFKVKY